MTPAKYDEVQATMDTLLYQVVYMKDLTEPSIAYTNARLNSTCGTIYKIFVNNSDKEFAKFLYLHECGHIIFAHAKNMNARMDAFLLSKISVAYSRLAKYFTSYDKYLEVFRNMLFNVVMDFEVNSRLFSKEEWDFMNERLEPFTGCKGAKGLWPEDYGFAPGLTWNEYLNLILMNPESFFEQIRELIDENISMKEGNEADSVNGKNGQGKEKQKSENGEGFNGHLSAEEYEKIKQKYKDSHGNAKQFDEDELKELEKMAAEHNDASYGVPTGNMDGLSRKKNRPVTIDFDEYFSMDELLRKISRLIQVECKKNSRRDLMYNRNRRKYDSNVLIPRYVTDERHRKGNLVVLLDVSGSVDSKMVYDFVSTFREVQQNFKDTKFISWNTRLVAEWDISEPIPTQYGGGTFMAGGIQFISEKYRLKKTDTLFVISDFCDILESWEPELNKFICNKYAINWNREKPYLNPGFQKILQYNRQKVKRNG